MDARKPPAAVRMERRDVLRGFRFTESEDASLRDGAATEGVDFSTYCRTCLLTGHTMRQAQRLVKAAGV